MFNSYSTVQASAMFAEQGHAVSMPCRPMSMPAMYMGMAAATSATAAYITLLKTGVSTSVSLFVVGILIGLLLLVGLVVLISLILTGLTRLVGLESLVGQNRELATNATQGD